MSSAGCADKAVSHPGGQSEPAEQGTSAQDGVVIETEYILAREHHLGTATQQSMQLFRCVLAMHLYRHVNGLVVVVFLFACLFVLRQGLMWPRVTLNG